jgi:hypothetical protein
VVDAFNGNVKLIDLSTGKVECSAAISKLVRLKDIILFNELLVVSSENDSIYVINKDLKLLAKHYVVGGRANFVRTYGKDSLSLFFPDSQTYVTINSKFEPISKRKVGFEDRGREIFYKNKCVKEIGNNLYRTQFGLMFTDINLFLDEVDFDSLRVVSLQQDSGSLRLSIHKIILNK